MARRIVSRDVGRKGDLRAAIFLVVWVVGVEGISAGLGIGDGDLFWIRAERRGVTDGESMLQMLLHECPTSEAFDTVPIDDCGKATR